MCGVPHFRANTRTGNPVQIRYHSASSLPGLYYHLGAKYQIGVTPFRSNARDGGTPFKSNTRPAPFPKGVITERGYPMQIRYQGVGHPLLVEYQGCSPLQIKYENGATPLRSNTRDVLSLKSETLGVGHPAGPSTGGGYSYAEQVPERCYPSKLNTRIWYPFQAKYQ